MNRHSIYRYSEYRYSETSLFRHMLVGMVAFLLCLPCPRSLSGAGIDNSLKTWKSSELIGRAKSYIEADTLLDRAVEALSIVANRYYENPEDKEARHNAVEAMTQLSGIYSYRIFDFGKAYDYAATARLIAEEDKDD